MAILANFFARCFYSLIYDEFEKLEDTDFRPGKQVDYTFNIQMRMADMDKENPTEAELQAMKGEED